jgi:NAD(P)-dependent dehydrogenase (short-subunit alcohol dehydrogenase family)
MKDEKVVIIGGSSGMGLASGRRLAAEGYQVIISARSRARIAEALEKIGSDAAGFTLDYTDPKSIPAFFKSVGAFDHLLLAGAGPPAWGAFAALRAEALTTAFEIKFWGYFRCLQAALPTLRKDGSVILVTGAAARTAIPGTAGLAAVNGAIERMGITLAKELAPLRVNVLSPGIVDTPAYDQMPAEQKATMLRDTASQLPVQRYGRVDDIAEAVLFLTRERYITGAVLDVDGGIRIG